FVGTPTISTIKSGDWTDPSIWSLGRMPTNQDRVLITSGTQVNYGTVSSVHLDALEIDGSLIFATSKNTKVIAGSITLMPWGTLQGGTAASPVGSNYKAEIVIADKAIDTSTDPQQFGTGLIALGTVTIHGATMSQTWDQLAQDTRAGD